MIFRFRSYIFLAFCSSFWPIWIFFSPRSLLETSPPQFLSREEATSCTKCFRKGCSMIWVQSGVKLLYLFFNFFPQFPLRQWFLDLQQLFRITTVGLHSGFQKTQQVIITVRVWISFSLWASPPIVMQESTHTLSILMVSQDGYRVYPSLVDILETKDLSYKF